MAKQKKAKEKKSYDGDGVLELTKIDINRELSVKNSLSLSLSFSHSINKVHEQAHNKIQVRRMLKWGSKKS